MHQPVMEWVGKMLSKLPPRKQVVELGSFNINGSVRPLFGEAAYVGVDIRPGKGVDVVADAATYRPETAPDTVVSCEVLEHTAVAPAIVANAYDMLTPGGVLLITVAMPPRIPHSQIDGNLLKPGEFYENIQPDDLREWLRPFVDVHIEEHPSRGDLYAIAFKPAAPPAPDEDTQPIRKSKKAPANKMVTAPENKETVAPDEPGNDG